MHIMTFRSTKCSIIPGFRPAGALHQKSECPFEHAVAPRAYVPDDGWFAVVPAFTVDMLERRTAPVAAILGAVFAS
jgi:hypothetical protein